MQLLIQAGVVVLGYILGSIPFGLIFVHLITGRDVRTVASGRTGGTNAARAGGVGAGLLTALMDGAKGAVSVWLALAVVPEAHWAHVLTPLAAILGHNYSIFLLERDGKNRVRLRGGAGGGPTVGGAIGLWWPSAFIVLPLAALVFFGIGYASVTTLSIAIIVTTIFAVRHSMGLATLPDVFYGVFAFVMLAWALRPNIRALVEGRERFHGWRPWRKSRQAAAQATRSMTSRRTVEKKRNNAGTTKRRVARGKAASNRR
jgi:glycerol-3-phosphate acyltransferase PlsY